MPLKEKTEEEIKSYFGNQRVYQNMQVLSIPGILQMRVKRAPTGTSFRRVHPLLKSHIIQLQRFFRHEKSLRQIFFLRAGHYVHDIGHLFKVRK